MNTNKKREESRYGIIKFYQKNKEDNRPLDVQVKKGVITVEEAIMKEAEIFSFYAKRFIDDTINLKKVIVRHNCSCKTVEDAIEEVLNNTDPKNERFTRYFIKQMSKDYADCIDRVKIRNEICLGGGLVALIGARQLHLDFYHSIPDDFCERFLELCSKDVIKAAALERAKNCSHNPGFEYPSPDQFFTYLYFALLYKRYLEHEDDENAKSCFNKNGFVVDEQGTLLEEDLLERFIHIDYKGLDR